jgi:dTDP-4-amino-4,6-dideoxygalactose transaminase/acetyltransferase-like isoleucine patch superfamily enzyme
MSEGPASPDGVFIHETACVDQPCRIGAGTRIWHFCHVMAGAQIGCNCNLGQNVFVGGGARLGNNVKVQNNVSIYDGCVLEDDVFCGPSVVFTNIKNPRSAISRKGRYQQTHVERGATLGANATVVCGIRIGHHAFLAAGAVATADVVPYALMVGVPARQQGWAGHAGVRLRPAGGAGSGEWVCPETGERYRQLDARTLVPVALSTADRPGPPDATPVPMTDLQAQFREIEGPIRAALDRVLTSQRFILGEEVEAFEREMAAYVGARHAIGCASGSDALLLALMALELQPGDEVLTTPYTFFATAGAVWRLGLRAVFADIDPATYNLDVSDLERHHTPRLRAVLPVHLFGQCCDMGPLLEFARRHGLAVVEDAAQAVGGRYRGGMAGTLGTLGCYSFFPSKNLGGYGDGGMVVTNDADLATRLRALRSHGAARKYYHDLVGLNSRLDAVQAAVLRAKLPRLDGWTEARRARAAAYREQLGEALPAGCLVLPREADFAYHVYNQFVIRVAARDRDPLRAHLKQAGIAAEVYYPLPLHLQPCARGLGYQGGDYPRAEQASRETIALPIFPELRPDQQRRVVSALAEYFHSR